MKNVFIAAASIVGIIVVRMILSIACSEQVAEVFARVAIGALFFYYICQTGKFYKQHKNKLESSN